MSCDNKLKKECFDKLENFINGISDKNGCLITVLHQAQEIFGYLPHEVQEFVAEKLNLPVIISHAELHEQISPLSEIGSVMVLKAKEAKVPVCVHLDHGSDYTFVMRAIRCGFTSIMYDLSALPFEDNVLKLKEFADQNGDGKLDLEDAKNIDLGNLANTVKEHLGGLFGGK